MPANRFLSLISYALCALFYGAGCSAENDEPLRIAYSVNDQNYQATATMLADLLKHQGLTVDLIPMPNSIEAARSVAVGDSDFSLIMDQTDLESALRQDVYALETVAPLFRRVIYVMYNPTIQEGLKFGQLIQKRKIFAGVEGGEKYASFVRYMEFAGLMDQIELTSDSAQADILFWWGDTNSDQAELLAQKGWKPFYLGEMGRNSFALRLGQLEPYDLPPTPSMDQNRFLTTLSANVLLLTSKQVDEAITYAFARSLFNAKPYMASQNPIYQHLNESFDPSSVPYPVHPGVEAYFRRDEPTFWEKYAEVIALGFALIAGISGIVQSVRLWLHKRSKEQLDIYLREFAVIKNGPNKNEKLEELFNTALEKLTAERLEKQDFDMLARLIYSEITAK